jgi:hypothetical protein
MKYLGLRVNFCESSRMKLKKLKWSSSSMEAVFFEKIGKTFKSFKKTGFFFDVDSYGIY